MHAIHICIWSTAGLGDLMARLHLRAADVNEANETPTPGRPFPL